MKSNLRIFVLVCLAGSIASTIHPQDTGADIYKAKCLMCHSADGLGVTPVGKSLKIVSFKDPSVEKSSNAELVAVIKSGKNNMPPFVSKLSDAQIRAVVQYIRTLQK